MSRSSQVVLMAVLVLFLSSLGGCEAAWNNLWGKPSHVARQRVDDLLAALQRANGYDSLEFRMAAGHWWNEATADTRQEQDWAVEAFHSWLSDGHLTPGFGSYEIHDASLMVEQETRVVRVTGDINGRRFAVAVSPDQPIRWLRAPRPSENDEV